MLKYKFNIKTALSDGINVNIPLDTNIDLTLRKNELTNEKYFQRVKEDIIPSIVDTEKVVLYPAIKVTEDKFILADEIEMNFHFRKRLNDDWSVRNGWSTNDSLEWNDKYYADPRDTSHGTYTGDIDNISDLVGFLGFDNDDIKYQKNKVKQSFFRLMYYDSNSILGKNMLTYSTTFLDINKLYSKYSLMVGNDDFTNYYKKSQSLISDDAIENSFTLFEPSAINEKYEDLRLSTRLSLKSKNHQDASSDGFYLYLFKEDAPDDSDIMIYLRMEFNNAGYGKRVNLVLPKRNSDGRITPIKFSDEDFPKDYITSVFDGNQGYKFDVERFYDDLYVPVNCRYSKDLKKYIYYFPIDGVNDVDNRKIVLNFWEPKLNKKNES